MKVRVLCLLLLISSIIATVGAQQDGQRWRLIVKSVNGNNYYIDQDSLTVSDYNTTRAWYKIVPVKESSIFDKIRNLRFFGIQISDAAYYKLYCEIDCTRKYLKTLITTAYTKEDRVLRREETLDTKWTTIPEQSSFDMIRDIVCGIK